MSYMGKASTEPLRKILEQREQERKEQEQRARKLKAWTTIQEILQEDEDIKNKKHIKKIK